jgi:hypothetical protein
MRCPTVVCAGRLWRVVAAHGPGSDNAVMAESSGWVVLVYRVPSEPSRLRAQVWRRLRQLGALYLQNAVVALPADPAAERSLLRLQEEITTEMGGSAQVFRAVALAGQEQVIASMNAARDEEYAEIVDRCRDFLTEIERETAATHFTYAELEENEEDLNKLRSWFEKVRGRDRFDAGGAGEAEQRLAECATVLEEFAARVYARDSTQDV